MDIARIALTFRYIGKKNHMFGSTLPDRGIRRMHMDNCGQSLLARCMER